MLCLNLNDFIWQMLRKFSNIQRSILCTQMILNETHFHLPKKSRARMIYEMMNPMPGHLVLSRTISPPAEHDLAPALPPIHGPANNLDSWTPRFPAGCIIPWDDMDCAPFPSRLPELCPVAVAHAPSDKVHKMAHLQMQHPACSMVQSMLWGQLTNRDQFFFSPRQSHGLSLPALPFVDRPSHWI